MVLTTHKGVTTGFISHGTETFEVMPGRGGKHLLYKVDAEKLPKVEEVREPPAMAGDTAAASDYGLGGASADGATSGQVHDLLVVYTAAAKNRYGQASLESQIVSAVAAANQAYQNSQVGIALNLVAMYEAPFAEAGSTTDTLMVLRANTTVRGWRDQHAADLVISVGENTDHCGYAWIMTSPSTGFADYAYGAVLSSCLSNHTLAHEIGHLQGNHHDRETAGAYGGAYPYSYGFRRCATDGSGFRTVMSYSCSGANRIAQFSSPNISYNGYATGISYESNASQSAENERSMNNTAAIVAAFRGGSSGGATPPPAPSSLSATANSSSSVTIRWTDNASNESGFRVERSANGVDFTEVATVGAGATSFADNGVAANTSYWYRARACSSAGNSGYSNTGSVTTPGAPPAPPASVSALDNADGSAVVLWTAASGAASYEVVREAWDSRRSRWKAGATVATVPASLLSVVDVSGSGTFRYSVRAAKAGGASGYGGPAQVTVSGGSFGGGRGAKDQPPGKNKGG